MTDGLQFWQGVVTVTVCPPRSERLSWGPASWAPYAVFGWAQHLPSVCGVRKSSTDIEVREAGSVNLAGRTAAAASEVSNLQVHGPLSCCVLGEVRTRPSNVAAAAGASLPVEKSGLDTTGRSVLFSTTELFFDSNFISILREAPVGVAIRDGRTLRTSGCAA